jgi:hypothetical protein
MNWFSIVKKSATASKNNGVKNVTAKNTGVRKNTIKNTGTASKNGEAKNANSSYSIPIAIKYKSYQNYYRRPRTSVNIKSTNDAKNHTGRTKTHKQAAISRNSKTSNYNNNVMLKMFPMHE